MIKCTLGMMQFEGSAPVIMTELEMLISRFLELTKEKFGEEEAEEMLDEIIRNAKMTREERDKQNEELAKKFDELVGADKRESLLKAFLKAHQEEVDDE